MTTPVADRRRLLGRRVLITGASSGVGLAATRLFAAEGASLALVSRRSEQLRRMLGDEGIDAVALTADLGDRAAASAAVDDAVAALGGLDVVVSNAAAAVFGHVLEVDPDDFDRTVQVTFTGAVSSTGRSERRRRRSSDVAVFAASWRG